MNSAIDGHGKNDTPENETCHAWFPDGAADKTTSHLNPLGGAAIPQADEREGNKLQREFHAEYPFGRVS